MMLRMMKYFTKNMILIVEKQSWIKSCLVFFEKEQLFF